MNEPTRAEVDAFTGTHGAGIRRHLVRLLPGRAGGHRQRHEEPPDGAAHQGRRRQGQAAGPLVPREALADADLSREGRGEGARGAAEQRGARSRRSSRAPALESRADAARRSTGRVRSRCRGVAAVRAAGRPTRDESAYAPSTLAKILGGAARSQNDEAELALAGPVVQHHGHVHGPQAPAVGPVRPLVERVGQQPRRGSPTSWTCYFSGELPELEFEQGGKKYWVLAGLPGGLGFDVYPAGQKLTIYLQRVGFASGTPVAVLTLAKLPGGATSDHGDEAGGRMRNARMGEGARRQEATLQERQRHVHVRAGANTRCRSMSPGGIRSRRACIRTRTACARRCWSTARATISTCCCACRSTRPSRRASCRIWC